MNSQQRQQLFARLRAANPEPTTELEYATTFQLLIAVILSAQATDKSVNLATRKLFADAPTPQAMLALGEAGWPPTSTASVSIRARPETSSPPVGS
jgi:endonuclease-3